MWGNAAVKESQGEVIRIFECIREFTFSSRALEINICYKGLKKGVSSSLQTVHFSRWNIAKEKKKRIYWRKRRRKEEHITGKEEKKNISQKRRKDEYVKGKGEKQEKKKRRTHCRKR